MGAVYESDCRLRRLFRRYVDDYEDPGCPSLACAAGCAVDADTTAELAAGRRRLPEECNYALPCIAVPGVSVYGPGHPPDRHRPCFAAVKLAYARLTDKERPPSSARARELVLRIESIVQRHRNARRTDAPRAPSTWTSFDPARDVLLSGDMAHFVGAAGAPALRWFLERLPRDVYVLPCNALLMLYGATCSGNMEFVEAVATGVMRPLGHMFEGVRDLRDDAMAPMCSNVAKYGNAPAVHALVRAAGAMSIRTKVSEWAYAAAFEAARARNRAAVPALVREYLQHRGSINVLLYAAAQDDVDDVYRHALLYVPKHALPDAALVCLKYMAPRCLETALLALDGAKLPLANCSVERDLCMESVCYGLRCMSAAERVDECAVAAVLRLLREHCSVSATDVTKVLVTHAPGAIDLVARYVEDPAGVIAYVCTCIVDVMRSIATTPAEHVLSVAMRTHTLNGYTRIKSTMLREHGLGPGTLTTWINENEARLGLTPDMRRVILTGEVLREMFGTK